MPILFADRSDDLPKVPPGLREVPKQFAAQAHELEELTLIEHDLKTSLKSLKLWAEKYTDNGTVSDEQRIISGSLFRDGIVQFLPSFDPKRGYHLKRDEVYTKDDQREYFEFLQDVRDCYAAHAFSPARQCLVGLHLDESDAASPLRSVSAIIGITATLLKEEAPPLMSFIAIAGQYTTNKLTKLREELREQIRTIPTAELLQLPVRKLVDLRREDLRTSRRKFSERVRAMTSPQGEGQP